MYQVQKQKGITLIALVITIVVLIILAGVAINLTVGENGILTKAKQAKTDYNLAKEREELELEIANIQIEIMSEENRAATLNDLYARIDKNKYAIELKFDPVAATENVNTTPTYSIINKIGSKYYFTVDSKLVITDVETREPKVSYITFSDITWNSGKASITLSTKEQGTIEYKVGEDGVYAPGTTISNLSHGDTVYARINNNGEYTEEETKVIYDGIKPEEFSITTSDLTYNSVKLTTTGTTDNQTGLATYSYVAATSSSQIVKEITGQTATEYPITGLEEQTEYVVYMLAYDNAGNVRKSNEVTVKTEAMPVAKLFGQYVNYIDLDGDASTPDWQVFYKEDGELNPDYEGATYIIPKYYVPYSKMTTSIANAGMSLYTGTYRVRWSSAPSSYVKMSNYDTIKQIFMYDYTGESNDNVKCVSTLLYTDYWKDDFVTLQLQAKGGMAIGGPTINMWCASWNKAYPTQKITPTISGDGYKVNGSSWIDISSYTGYTNAPNVYFPTKSQDSDGTDVYWLASPSSASANGLMFVGYDGHVNYSDYYYGYLGVRPLVYLPSSITLEPSGTPNVWNINYGN